MGDYSTHKQIATCPNLTLCHWRSVDKHLSTVYRIECIKPDGEIRWVDVFHNLVTTEGLNDSLDKHFKGSSYTAAWYVGLASSSPTFALTDTMSSHSGWTEITNYSETVRQTLTLGSASGGSIDNSASVATFSIDADNATIGGAFVVSNSTKSGTTGVLYGGGALNSGNRTTFAGDTLKITITISASN